ncbi:cupin domain-containing protein [Asinibacterium sp. OR53]|uniref:cupin domain-containing protein n=1 Tax=Asinibacterium sp. OR53 TaxID=925409 RepID=UPI0004B8E4E5|nr:cupin domain-containing protein [Asinibacterium sp. OR53]
MKRYPMKVKATQEIAAVSRRSVLKHITMAGAGMALLNVAAGNTVVNAHGNLPQLSPFYLPPQPPLQPGPIGYNIRTWVRSSQTNKQFSCVETAVAPKQMGPAPHVHHDLDEIMFVLEGTATVWMDGKVQEIAAGGWHLRPRRIPHTFWNGADKPLRFIDMYFNQNFEDFLEELFHQIIPDMQKLHLSPADPVIVKRMAELDSRFGVTTFHEKRQPLIEKYKLKP